MTSHLEIHVISKLTCYSAPWDLYSLPSPQVQFNSVQLLSCIWLCDPMDCSTPSFPIHHQLLELTQTHVHQVGDAIQPSYPLLFPSLLPSVFPNIRGFSNESAFPIRWPKYWSFSFSISPSNEYSGLISLQFKGLSRVYFNTTVHKHQLFAAQFSL